MNKFIRGPRVVNRGKATELMDQVQADFISKSVRTGDHLTFVDVSVPAIADAVDSEAPAADVGLSLIPLVCLWILFPLGKKRLGGPW